MWAGVREAAGGLSPHGANRPRPSYLRASLSQACFASLVSQDYVNGTDQEEIRTGEPPEGRGGELRCGVERRRLTARPAGLTPSAAFERCSSAAARLGIAEGLDTPQVYSAGLKCGGARLGLRIYGKVPFKLLAMFCRCIWALPVVCEPCPLSVKEV